MNAVYWHACFIKEEDPAAGPKNRRYLPAWA